MKQTDQAFSLYKNPLVSDAARESMRRAAAARKPRMEGTLRCPMHAVISVRSDRATLECGHTLVLSRSRRYEPKRMHCTACGPRPEPVDEQPLEIDAIEPDRGAEARRAAKAGPLPSPLHLLEMARRSLVFINGVHAEITAATIAMAMLQFVQAAKEKIGMPRRLELIDALSQRPPKAWSQGERLPSVMERLVADDLLTAVAGKEGRYQLAPLSDRKAAAISAGGPAGITALIKERKKISPEKLEHLRLLEQYRKRTSEVATKQQGDEGKGRKYVTRSRHGQAAMPINPMRMTAIDGPGVGGFMPYRRGW